MIESAFTGPKPHILVIVLIASLGAFNLAILSPSLAEIAVAMNAPYSQVQLMLSGYMALSAVLQLIIGPLSDLYGRRPVLLASLVIFLAGTVLCILADSIEVLLAGRMIQASVIGGLVLSRAIVRDIVPMNRAASMLGYVTMGMTLAPMIAPIVGGFFANQFGWKANFFVILAFGGFVTLACAFGLPETNRTRAGSMSAQFRAWPSLLKSRHFWGYALTATFCSGVYFIFLGGAPYVGGTQLKMSQTDLGYLFAFVSIGYIGGNFLSGRFSMAWGAVNIMIAGSLVSIVGGIVPYLLFESGLGGPMAFFLPMMLVGLGNGMTLPSANAGIVSVRPDLAGAASGLGGALTVGGGALLSVLGSAVLSPDSGPGPLLVIMVASATLSLLATLYVRAMDRLDETA